ncbi:type II toxin-antitoxin system RelE/ParE family toxin [Pontiella sp.]|uniref:type II toxin-antitoxin system RelE/ParE family toxin n=1 Tax=Pontiella sp. TaxID=2837462 RepID=UPI0035637999
MSIILVPPADAELQDAIDFYNDQMTGLGDRFYEAFTTTISILENNPTLWRRVGEHTRRVNLGRFPFFIMYVHEDSSIYITCIAHHHRDPEYYINRQR